MENIRVETRTRFGASTIEVPQSNKLQLSAVIWTGLIAGMIFMMMEMLLNGIFLGMSPWGPVRMMAAIILGKGVLPPPATFSLGVAMVAMMLHLMLSIAYTGMAAAIYRPKLFGVAAITGGIYGLFLYLANFYVFTGIFPWFAMARNWVGIISHIIFGMAAGALYVGLSRRQRGNAR